MPKRKRNDGDKPPEKGSESPKKRPKSPEKDSKSPEKTSRFLRMPIRFLLLDFLGLYPEPVSSDFGDYDSYLSSFLEIYQSMIESDYFLDIKLKGHSKSFRDHIAMYEQSLH